MSLSRFEGQHKRRASFLDMQAELESMPDASQTFPPSVVPGVRVIPNLASPVEGWGDGRVVSVSEDRSCVVARFAIGLATLEPWDVTVCEDGGR